MVTIFGLFFGSFGLFMDAFGRALEARDEAGFVSMLWIFGGMLLFVAIVSFFRVWLRKGRSIKTRLVMYKEYTAKYIYGDNTKRESMGTGKTNSITQK
jgi:ABC-type uncharacterized transport system fused permease/ATPase subunit